MNNPEHLTFFITLNKLTEELTLQEGGLISLKIPKHWQKPDSNINNPALWVCHLPVNSLGITYISLYPTELVIKKKDSESETSQNKGYSNEIDLELDELENYKDDSLIVYKGSLEPNGENDKERFYRCRLRLQEQIVPVQKSSNAGIWIFIIFVVVGLIIFAVASQNRGRTNLN